MPTLSSAASAPNQHRTLEDVVADAARAELCVLPLPKRRYFSTGYHAMSHGEAARIVASYNAWVEVWNRHERDRALPLSPRWDYAETACWPSGPANAIYFRTRADDRVGIICIEDEWDKYYPGWSCCKNPIDADAIKWAAWRKPDPLPTPEEIEEERARREASEAMFIKRVRAAASKRPRAAWVQPEWRRRYL